ncbi:MAG TPA: dihydropteroate synthase [bacterium]|nr:dihydropteroate synthase [bacterium]
MIIIGERLNSSRRPVLEALRDRNAAYVLKEAAAQERAGADYIDINAAAVLGRETEVLTWIIPLVQGKLRVPLSIDTPNLEAMEAGLRLHKGQALLNSLTGETERVRRFLPLIQEHRPRVIALCLDDQGIPTTAEQEVAIAGRLIEVLTRAGVAAHDIFLDPLVRPVSVDEQAVTLFLDSLDRIKQRFPQVGTVAGISNVSFGLPQRRLLNRALLALASMRGLDAAILDPLDREIVAERIAVRALLGRDPSFKDYLAFARKIRKQT